MVVRLKYENYNCYEIISSTVIQLNNISSRALLPCDEMKLRGIYKRVTKVKVHIVPVVEIARK
jgi:hypothetical protein